MQPTNAELDILRTIWDRGPSTVREVNEALNARADRDIGYTTTLKQMQIMHDKGMLSRSKQGKTHTYAAAVAEQETQRGLLDRLIDTAFQGSALKLVMQALGQGRASAEELEAIRELLDQIEEDQAGSNPSKS